MFGDAVRWYSCKFLSVEALHIKSRQKHKLWWYGHMQSAIGVLDHHNNDRSHINHLTSWDSCSSGSSICCERNARDLWARRVVFHPLQFSELFSYCPYVIKIQHAKRYTLHTFMNVALRTSSRWRKKSGCDYKEAHQCLWIIVKWKICCHSCNQVQIYCGT